MDSPSNLKYRYEIGTYTFLPRSPSIRCEIKFSLQTMHAFLSQYSHALHPHLVVNLWLYGGDTWLLRGVAWSSPTPSRVGRLVGDLWGPTTLSPIGAFFGLPHRTRDRCLTRFETLIDICCLPFGVFLLLGCLQDKGKDCWGLGDSNMKRLGCLLYRLGIKVLDSGPA